jgi:hypothetical protein
VFEGLCKVIKEVLIKVLVGITLGRDTEHELFSRLITKRTYA